MLNWVYVVGSRFFSFEFLHLQWARTSLAQIQGLATQSQAKDTNNCNGGIVYQGSIYIEQI